MPVYFSPEVITPEFHVLNIVDSKDKALGNVAFLFDEKKMYVYGILEDEEVGADFKDIVTPYIKGLSKAKPGIEVYSCLYIGCKKITLNTDEEEEE
ncbi:hypothetical protein R4Z10_05505 [Niallia sp. XMNu-256]|uniref:hypothetical protein n=1 Tax=Niallia sp. XMNu-256 TaxID=3082444 RepID=UPI0030D0A7F4